MEQNQPPDKFYFIAPDGQAPKRIRGRLSELTNIAMAVPKDRKEWLNLHKHIVSLQGEPHYRTCYEENGKLNLEKFTEQLSSDLRYACSWWDESWRYGASWPFIEAAIFNKSLKSVVKPIKTSARIKVLGVTIWAFIKKHW